MIQRGDGDMMGFLRRQVSSLNQMMENDLTD